LTSAQGYTSSSSTGHSGTMFRCLGRSATVANRLRAQRVKEQQKAPFRSQAQLLAQLEVRRCCVVCQDEVKNIQGIMKPKR
jgi:hypothetical protein